jgi:hypothetical protein
VATTYYNWDELRLRSNNDLAAILCLTYGQTKLYNEISAKTMMRSLGLHHIPPYLFYKHYFTQYKRQLVCNYTTIEPQSYFKNPVFLFMRAPARAKVVYLKALSMRRINESQDYIPLKYFDNVKPNMFLEIKDDKILFPLESSVSRKYTTKN